MSRGDRPTRLAGLVDAHCHLQHERFDSDREAVIERAVDAGIERILVPGWDLPSSVAALALAERHAPLVQAAVGVHPHHAATLDPAAWGELEALASDARCSAVGEIGLDFFRNLSPPAVQREALTRQLALAADQGLPVIVHDRDAHEEITDALLRWAGPRTRAVRGVLHAFSGDDAMAARMVEAGFLISFALPVSFRSARGPRVAAAALPPGTFVVETDAPYLGPDRDRRNEPTTVLRVAAELGKLRGEDPQSVADDVRRAYYRLIVH